MSKSSRLKARRDIEIYLDWCFRRGNSNQTRHTKLTALSKFFRYLKYEGFVPEDITAEIPKPRITKKLMQLFTKRDILAMFGSRNSKHGGDNLEAVRCLYCRLSQEFGNASARTIMRKFLMELKGVRISFPDMEDLAREERDRKIRSRYNGCNCRELFIMFGISSTHVRRISRME